MNTSSNRPEQDRRRSPGDGTRWLVIGFAVVEAVLLGWVLWSGQLG